jgi:hypothetical protein
MNIAYGIALICVAIAMIWAARPADGVSVPIFKKVWVVGVLYVMATMVILVIGGAFIISSM